MSIAPIADRNPGIVPPWLQPSPEPKNPGIVPPWLTGEARILPIEDTFQTLPVQTLGTTAGARGVDTQFVSDMVDVSPTLIDALRAR